MTYSQASGAEAPAASVTERAGRLVSGSAALVSLALVIGVGVWGYKLLIRDVTGIPVVRAIEGPMRVPAEEPGGQIAEHQGLSVNEVAAAGEAGGPEDTLILAPRDVELAEEDQPIVPVDDPEPLLVLAPEADAPGAAADRLGQAVDPLGQAVDPLGAEMAASEEPAPAIDLNADADVAALVEQLVRGADPLGDVDEAAAARDDIEIIPASEPGVSRSIRPPLRPLALRAVQQTAAAAPEPASDTLVARADPVALPAGTRLVQLGAFDSPEIAAREWRRLSAEFAPFMAGKSRIIQEARSGGRTFFRLRAMGFDDLSEARRFCSALVAEDAGCIPVVTR